MCDPIRAWVDLPWGEAGDIDVQVALERTEKEGREGEVPDKEQQAEEGCPDAEES